MKTQLKEMRRHFVTWWMLANTAGWVLLSFCILYLYQWLYRSFPYVELLLFGIIAGIISGAILGVLQWLVLRRHIFRVYWWIAATLLGAGLGVPAGLVTYYYMFVVSHLSLTPYMVLPVFILPGIIVGALQYLILKRHFDRTLWWLLPSVLTWWLVPFQVLWGQSWWILALLYGSPILGLATGIISGAAFLFISRRPRAEMQLLPSIDQTKAGIVRFFKHLDKKLHPAREHERTWQVLPEVRASIGWKFVPWWALASMGGSLLGILLFAYSVGVIQQYMEPPVDNLSRVLSLVIRGVITGASFGIAFGFFQWLILRKQTTGSYWWIIDSILGLILGAIIAFLPSEAGSFGIRQTMKVPLGYIWVFVPGIVVGIFQQLTLRQHFKRAWLWIIPSSLSWSMLFFTVSESPLILVIIPALSLVIGTISGFTLLFILGRRKDAGASLSRKEGRQNKTWKRPLIDIAGRSVTVILITIVIGGSILLAREYSAGRPFQIPNGSPAAFPTATPPPPEIGPSETGIIDFSLAPPKLISPENGAILDNGRTDFQDGIIWDFDWADYDGATEYYLYVEKPGVRNPVVNLRGITDSSYRQARTSYIAGTNRFGWAWKVRAKVDGKWTPWSETRTFDAEPVDTDPPL
jgi:hypothetical protein